MAGVGAYVERDVLAVHAAEHRAAGGVEAVQRGQRGLDGDLPGANTTHVRHA